MCMSTKVVEISVPEYDIDKKPAYLKIGKKVDKVIEENFPDGKYLLRAVGSGEHPGVSLDTLARIVLDLGTDKYDPDRKGVCHDEFAGYDHDLQAGPIEINNGKLVIPESYKYPSEFGDVVWHFYEHTPLDRGYAVRVDLLLLYDLKKLKRARKHHPKARPVPRWLNKYLYKFKDEDKKQEALLGIVKITK